MDGKQTITVKEAAALLGMNPQTVRIGIETGAFAWGRVVQLKRKRYVIFRERFETETGIKTEPKGGTT